MKKFFAITIGILLIAASCNQQAVVGPVPTQPASNQPASLPSPEPCPEGQVPVGTTQGIPGHIICGPAQPITPAPVTNGGISGSVVIQTCGGANPPSGISNCQTNPASNFELTIQNVKDKSLTKVSTDASGIFKQSLPAGQYIIEKPSNPSIKGSASAVITVLNSKYVNVNLSYSILAQ